MATNKRVAKRQHRWLSSVEITGVVLSEPVLADAGNFRSLDKKEIAEFRKQREIWNLPKGMVEGDGLPAWLNFILEDFLGLKDKDYWQVGAAISANMVVNLSEHQEVLRPNRILIDDGQPVMLVLEVPREQSLDRTWLQAQGRWKASPTTKLDRLLRETKVELGLLTNGEAWRLVVASPSETTSWLTWTAHTWNDDILTLAAFKNLLGETRFFAGPREEVILELIKQSRERQLDVADQLGNQVREALQLLVHELDRVDADLNGEYLKDYTESEIFESTVAFIMRLIFTLYAEENGLLPHGNVAYDRAYGVLHLLTELEETKRISPDKLKHSYSAYARLLASTQLLHDGSIDPDIRIAAHGGQLFDPNRYPLLDGRTKTGVWVTEEPEPPKVRDSVVRGVLRSLKYAKADGVRQIVSYRTLAVEQIGHMYEGLLDRRVARAPSDETLLLLQGGAQIKEPDPIAASTFNGLDPVALTKILAKFTSKTANTIRTILESEEDRYNLPDLGTDDVELLEIANPVIRFIKKLGIVRPGGLYVTQGQDRRSSGAHYTPPTLTEPVVRRTLEHQVFVNVDGKPGLVVEPKLIKSPEEILSLKVCDPAMGSGAFLVQATRYLAERLVDAWESVSAKQPDVVLTMPFARPSHGDVSENLIPESREERIVFARRYVAERCIYGVDMNRLAVEMAKLSLWLTTLSSDRPFTFVDHALKHGNSLVGLTPKEIREFTWRPLNGVLGPLFNSQSDGDVKEVEQHREAIHDIPDHDFIGKETENRIAEEALDKVRMKANIVVASFFNGVNLRQRNSNLITYRFWFDRLDEDINAKSKLQGIIDEISNSDKAVNPFCWQVEYPEVFYRDNSGFDAVIGNPPWGDPQFKSLKDLWKLKYPDILGRIVDLFHMFVIQAAQNLINKKSAIGFILPDVSLYQSYGAPLRSKLLADFNSIEVADIEDGIFRGVTRPCCAIVLKNLTGSDGSVAVYPKINQSTSAEFGHNPIIVFTKEQLLKLPNTLIPTKNVDDIAFATTVMSTIGQTLAELIDDDGIQRGASADKKDVFIVNFAEEMKYELESDYLEKVIDNGGLITPFCIGTIDKKLIYTERGFDQNTAPNIASLILKQSEAISCKEVKEGKHTIFELHRARSRKIFDKKEKVVGVITSDSPRVAVDTEGLYALDGVYIFGTKEGIDPYYMAGILNSKYFLRIYRVLAQEEGRVMAQVKPTILTQMPAPNPLGENFKWAGLVSRITENAKKLHKFPQDENLLALNDKYVEDLYTKILKGS